MKSIVSPAEINKYTKAAIPHILELMKFRSVSGVNPTAEHPFGAECDKALNYMINLAQTLGFKTFISARRTYGYIEYGEGKEIFGILCHLDVVPEGDRNQWTKSAWNPLFQNDELFGRGALDDKGPAIINLFALNYLKNKGFVPAKYKIRIIMGLSEETTWESINDYIKHEPDIATGYVPDGQWPVIYSEKGILELDIVGPGQQDWIAYTPNGAQNMVCDNLAVESMQQDIGELIGNLIENGAHFNRTSNRKKITIIGKAAHGSTPENGDNAIFHWIKALINGDYHIPPVVQWLQEHYADNHHDLPLIFNGQADESGNVTSNIGLIGLSSQEQRVAVEIRLPAMITKTQAIAAVEKSLQKYPDLKLHFNDWVQPKYVPLNDARLQTMLSIYRSVTGNKDAEPIAIGGATYARACENLVAFGAADSVELMHSPNERVSIEALKKMFAIYVQAIHDLNQ